METSQIIGLICIGGFVVFAGFVGLGVYAGFVLGAEDDKLQEKLVDKMIEQRKNEKEIEKRLAQMMSEAK
jgi:hypothetical protein